MAALVEANHDGQPPKKFSKFSRISFRLSPTFLQLRSSFRLSPSDGLVGPTSAKHYGTTVLSGVSVRPIVLDGTPPSFWSCRNFEATFSHFWPES